MSLRLVALGAATLLVSGCLSQSIDATVQDPSSQLKGKPLVVSAVVHGYTIEKFKQPLSKLPLHHHLDYKLKTSNAKFDYVEAVKTGLYKALSRRLPQATYVNNLRIGVPDQYDASFNASRYEPFIQQVGLDGLFIIKFTDLKLLGCGNVQSNAILASLLLPPLIGMAWGYIIIGTCDLVLRGDFSVQYYDVKKRAVTREVHFSDMVISKLDCSKGSKLRYKHLGEGFRGFVDVFDIALGRMAQ